MGNILQQNQPLVNEPLAGSSAAMSDWSKSFSVKPLIRTQQENTLLLFRHAWAICLNPLMNANSCCIKVALTHRRPIADTAVTSREQPAWPKRIHRWICGMSVLHALHVSTDSSSGWTLGALWGVQVDGNRPTEVGGQKELWDASFFSIQFPLLLLGSESVDFDPHIKVSSEQGRTCHLHVCPWKGMRVTEKEEATLRTAMVRNYRIGIVTQIGIKSGHFFFFF